MYVYEIELEYSLDPSVESYLYANNVFIIEEPKAPDYGVSKIYVKTRLKKDELINLVNVRRIIKTIRIKCDMCNNQKISDENANGAGFVPFCRKEHWGGFSEQDFIENQEYCIYRDTCIDFE